MRARNRYMHGIFEFIIIGRPKWVVLFVFPVKGLCLTLVISAKPLDKTCIEGVEEVIHSFLKCEFLMEYGWCFINK